MVHLFGFHLLSAADQRQAKWRSKVSNGTPWSRGADEDQRTNCIDQPIAVKIDATNDGYAEVEGRTDMTSNIGT
ncbi:hypothetical protein [Rathayibacter sp. PhB152]|uniref:hypothetical protein n=1 Tax=Rathayibacter sp. PhB152 TaxID=2485190 RepID=UPI001C852231|nr:hypothetical protein [Rathayibacter sp. PhB152]